MGEKAQERSRSARPDSPELLEALDAIRDALRGMKFGEVTITVQDGVVIQLERTERTRLRRGRG
jgi:hypothetical protein